MLDLLRDVDVEGYRLRTWDVGKVRGGKTVLAYEFNARDGSVLFSGEDFACSPLHAIDSDETLRSLLTFLTLRPGDTDADYFASYTMAQMEFADGDAEYISMYATAEEGAPQDDFKDWRDDSADEERSNG